MEANDSSSGPDLPPAGAQTPKSTSSNPPSSMITSDTDLLALLQVRLCRFCCGASTASRPFAQSVCACQGPNSATHAACLVAYLEANPHNRTRCDVCCRPYHLATSRRSPLEWAASSDAWGHHGGSSSSSSSDSGLSPLLQLAARTLNILWALVVSVVIVLSTTTYSSSSWLQILFGLLIIAFSVFRLRWVVLVLLKVAAATRDQMDAWLAANQKVTLLSSGGSGLSSHVQDKSGTGNSGTEQAAPKKELKLTGHSAIRAAGLKQPKPKTVMASAFSPSSPSSPLPKSGKKDV